MCRRQPFVAALLVSVTGAACGQDQIDVRPTEEGGATDYGRADLLAAVGEMEKTPESPAAFRRFAAKMELLRPRFTEEVEELAERLIVERALVPMEAVFDQPLADQMAALGVTVWPTAFETPPLEGEEPADYAERVCAESGPLSLDCHYVVPQHWPLVLGKLAWENMAERARDAYTACPPCENDPSWQQLLDAYRQRAESMLTRRSQVGDDALRDAWPRAGASSKPWSGAPLFTRNGSPTLEGTPIPGGQWEEHLQAHRKGRTTLGVYLHPKEQVRTLRAIARAAAAAGFTEIALQARATDYPYPEREYRFAIGRRARGPRVRVRDVETIQVLVQALDATKGDRIRLSTR